MIDSIFGDLVTTYYW